MNSAILPRKFPPGRLPVDLDALLSIGELVSSALLAIALADLGQPPRTFTGSMAGLITDNIHGKAHITDVRPDRVRNSLARGEVPIVAGFQGRTQKAEQGDHPRPRRLGSHRGRARRCARGRYLRNLHGRRRRLHRGPRVVPTARKIEVLSSEEMLEFAASGCKVLHLRCVEYARRFGIPIHVRSSFVPEPGTLILPGLDRHPLRQPAREQPEVTGVAGVNSASKITVVGIPDQPDSMARILHVLSRSGAHVQAIVQKRPARVKAFRRCPDRAGRPCGHRPGRAGCRKGNHWISGLAARQRGGQGVHHRAGYAVFPRNFLHLPQGPVGRRRGPRSLRHIRDVRGGRHARRPARGRRAGCPAGIRHGPGGRGRDGCGHEEHLMPAVGPRLETWGHES